MVLTYENRKGDAYYLHQGLTKKGNPRYFFSRQKDDKVLQAIPDGYEIYENPNGLVFIRKIQPKVFSDEEISVVENGIRDYANLEFYKVDVKGNAIIIYLPLQDVDAIKEVVSLSSLKTPEQIKEIIHKFIRFAPEMQLILTDKVKRLFSLKRYCYRGATEHWLTLETSSALDSLAKKYFKHLGKDSFFDLLPEFYSANPRRVN